MQLQAQKIPKDGSQVHGHDAHVPRLSQGDRQRHTQERIEGVALFQAVGTGQGRSVRVEDTHESLITLNGLAVPQKVN